MTMKGIAERAGVGRQTVYRWWSTKAEILFEACVDDAAHELAPRPRATTVVDITAYLTALRASPTESAAGAANRALVGGRLRAGRRALSLEAADGSWSS